MPYARGAASAIFASYNMKLATTGSWIVASRQGTGALESTGTTSALSLYHRRQAGGTRNLTPSPSPAQRGEADGGRRVRGERLPALKRQGSSYALYFTQG